MFSWQEHFIELEIHKFSPPWNILYILAFENFDFFNFHYQLAWRHEFYFRVITTILKPSFGRFSSNSRPVAQQMCSLCATSCLPDVSNVLKNDASNPEKKRKKISSIMSLFAILSIFGWSDLLQILCLQAAFSFEVLCIMMFFHVKYHWRRNRFPACLLLIGPSNFRRSNRMQCIVFWELITYLRQ